MCHYVISLYYRSHCESLYFILFVPICWIYIIFFRATQSTIFWAAKILSKTFIWNLRFTDMASYLKSQFTLAKAEDVVATKFTEINYEEFFDDELAISGRHYMKFVFHYVVKHQRKITYTKPNRGTFKNRITEVAAYDRFCVFGMEGRPNVLRMFIEKAEDSRAIFRYSAHFKPGDTVLLLTPELVGHLKETQNVLVKTTQPLVPDMIVPCPEICARTPLQCRRWEFL